MFVYTFLVWCAFAFRRKLQDLVVFEILIWSTSSKLRTYDTDVNFTDLRTSY